MYKTASTLVFCFCFWGGFFGGFFLIICYFQDEQEKDVFIGQLRLKMSFFNITMPIKIVKERLWLNGSKSSYRGALNIMRETLDYFFSKLYFAAQFTLPKIQWVIIHKIKCHEFILKKYRYRWQIKVYENMSPTSSMRCHLALENRC